MPWTENPFFWRQEIALSNACICKEAQTLFVWLLGYRLFLALLPNFSLLLLCWFLSINTQSTMSLNLPHPYPSTLWLSPWPRLFSTHNYSLLDDFLQWIKILFQLVASLALLWKQQTHSWNNHLHLIPTWVSNRLNNFNKTLDLPSHTCSSIVFPIFIRESSTLSAAQAKTADSFRQFL